MAFRLKQYRALWGMINATDGHLARSPHTQWEEFLPAVAALGYDGIEAPRRRMHAVLDEVGAACQTERSAELTTNAPDAPKLTARDRANEWHRCSAW